LDRLIKNLQLSISAIVVFIVALIYGANPSKIIPLVFDFPVDHLELKNIFRAIMGLYLAFAVYWVIGIMKPQYWRGATISNVLFMGGLAFGRLVSLIFDGVSLPYSVGLALELLMMVWGIYNLRNRKV